jgi:hypothetical protein
MCRNHSFSGNTQEHATRFIALAKVGNTLKHKWLYAFSLAPIGQMRATDLYQETTDQTDCPYTGNLLQPSLSKKQVVVKVQGSHSSEYIDCGLLERRR